jgi:uncharacterized membrane protein YphA (DoxX/SURF4 family)
MRFDGFAHALFALAVASAAILSFSDGDLVPIGQPFPAWIPWREAWVHGSALLLLLASVGLCFSRTAVLSAAAIALYQTVWAVISAMPLLRSKSFGFGAWYPFCEAVAPLVGAWILYAMLRWQSRRAPTPLASEGAVRVAQTLFGLTCIFYGTSHFAYADYTASMVPVWLRAQLGFAYLTGLAHIAAGVGIAVGILPRLAAVLEAVMMSLFGLLVWVPTFFTQPPPQWATPPRNQWSELVVNLLLAAAAWLIATSLRYRPWGLGPSRS